jgi:hypothetical protein
MEPTTMRARQLSFVAMVLAISLTSPVARGQVALPEDLDGQAASPNDRVIQYKDENGDDVTIHGRAMTIVPPQNLVDASGPNGESAESLRAKGFIYIDRNTNESLRKIDHGQYELRVLDEEGKFRTASIELGSRNDPEVLVEVEPDANGLFRYEYTIRNRSGQALMLMSLMVPETEAIRQFSGSGGWVGVAIPGRSRMGWLPLGDTPSLAAGSEVSGLEVTSAYLPALTEFRLTGVPNPPAEPMNEYSDFLQQALSGVQEKEGETVRRTVGPVIPPPKADPASRTRALDQLTGDVAEALNAGLVSGEGARELREILSEARTQASGGTAFEHLAQRAERIADVDSVYLRAFTTVLRSLGSA